jgi:tRNA (adenine57-N1/adenine58-N1)-methyltransferase
MTDDAALFRPGERVQLRDQKGRLFTVVLEPGKQFHTHRGAIEHDALIGCPEWHRGHGHLGTPYLALRPLATDFVLSMPRGAAVIYRRTPRRSSWRATFIPAPRVWRPGPAPEG